MATAAFHRVNYTHVYDGDKHDLAFTLSCDGLIDAPDCRLGMIELRQRREIEDALKLIGVMYGERYMPQYEQTVYNCNFENCYSRLVFDSIAVKYRSFRRRFNELSRDVCQKFTSAGGDPFLISSAYNSYLGIFDAFWGDTICADVRNEFINFLHLVEKECKNEQQE